MRRGVSCGVWGGESAIIFRRSQQSDVVAVSSVYSIIYQGYMDI